MHSCIPPPSLAAQEPSGRGLSYLSCVLLLYLSGNGRGWVRSDTGKSLGGVGVLGVLQPVVDFPFSSPVSAGNR